MSILRGIIRSTLYVRIQPNRFLVRHIESGREASSDSAQPFTTRRLLVGEFLLAETALRQAIKQVHYGNPFFSAPRIVIQPLAMTEGGLSPVEYRVLMEVAHCAGAKLVTVWVGAELSDEQVLEKANTA